MQAKTTEIPLHKIPLKQLKAEVVVVVFVAIAIAIAIIIIIIIIRADLIVCSGDLICKCRRHVFPKLKMAYIDIKLNGDGKRLLHCIHTLL